MSNPFVLVAQGFVAGAILFGMAMPSEAERQQQPEPVESASAENLVG